MTLPVRSAGFTLIELLLVLTIVGLLSGMLMLTAPHNSARTLESDVRGFQSLLEYTRALAVRNSEHYGISLVGADWQLLQFDSLNSNRRTWQRITWEEVNSSHSSHGWSQDTQATLVLAEVKGRRFSNTVAVTRPDVIAYSNGELSNFVIEVSSRADKALRYELQSDGFNLSIVRN